jgi:8-oxo-dGTP pyrophosphatase MutT (NUDIX family)
MMHQSEPEGFNPKLEIVSCFAEYDGEILLLHRQDHKPQGGTWGVPAGKIDIGETKEGAMAREFKQETGLNLEDILYFRKVFVRYENYDFVYHIFHKKFHEDIRKNVRINLDEHKAYLWVPPKKSLDMNLIQDLGDCIKLFYRF